MQYIIDLAGVPSNNSCIRMTYYPEARYIASQVLFVCTANVIETIPNPLLDRMEVISIAGYITDEKMHIARDYLEKTTREACGIKPEQVRLFKIETLFRIVRLATNWTLYLSKLVADTHTHMVIALLVSHDK